MAEAAEAGFSLFLASGPPATVHCPPKRMIEDEWLNIAEARGPHSKLSREGTSTFPSRESLHLGLGTPQQYQNYISIDFTHFN